VRDKVPVVIARVPPLNFNVRCHLMCYRGLGAIAFLLGLSAIAVCAYSVKQAPEMTALLVALAPKADPQDWKQHWLMESLATGSAGVVMLGGGVYLLARRAVGYVIVAGAFVGFALYGVLQRLMGDAKYAFEGSGDWDTVVMLGLAMGALIAYKRSRGDT